MKLILPYLFIIIINSGFLSSIFCEIIINEEDDNDKNNDLFDSHQEDTYAVGYDEEKFQGAYSNCIMQCIMQKNVM